MQELKAKKYLQKEHFDNMIEQGVDGLVYSWTLGGYPSVILELLGRIVFEKKTYDELLKERYGSQAEVYKRAFEALSYSFVKMPFCTMFFYVGPNSRAPALKFFREFIDELFADLGYYL